jgi:hypothetical protein
MPSKRVLQICHQNNGKFFLVFDISYQPPAKKVDFSASEPTNLFLKLNFCYLKIRLGIDPRLEYMWEVQYVLFWMSTVTGSSQICRTNREVGEEIQL